MQRYSVGGFGNAAGSTTLPAISIFATANAGFWLREVMLVNTTATAARYKLARLTARGTPGAGLAEIEWKEAGVDPRFEAFATHSVAPTFGADIYPLPIGAAIGSFVNKRFADYFDNGERGIYVPPGVGNGLGLVVAGGTGQITDAYLEVEQSD